MLDPGTTRTVHWVHWKYLDVLRMYCGCTIWNWERRCVSSEQVFQRLIIQRRELQALDQHRTHNISSQNTCATEAPCVALSSLTGPTLACLSEHFLQQWWLRQRIKNVTWFINGYAFRPNDSSTKCISFLGRSFAQGKTVKVVDMRIKFWRQSGDMDRLPQTVSLRALKFVRSTSCV